MQAHHQQTIDKLTALYKDDPRYLALIIGGSVAKGLAQVNSDVDFMLVATDADFAQRALTNDYFYYDDKITDYEGGYVDGKIIDLQFLRDVADHGSEVARSAFISAFVQFSRDDRIEPLVKAIPVYPEAQREAKIKAFYAQLVLGKWFVSEAEKRDDLYLKLHAATELVLYGSRLILAYNRILFPFHKWLHHAIHQAQDKPDDFETRRDALLSHPCKQNAEALHDCLRDYYKLDISIPESVIRFMMDREWAWRDGLAPLEDR